tara:strand:+ start:3780 stop:5441 length:1662 start_codon:yes stop_codon:yes gene_type:complete
MSNLLDPDSKFMDIVTGIRKSRKQNRKTRRNLMIGSFLVDAYEANQRRKVQQNLEELEEQKVFEQAKLAKQFDRQLDLLSINEEIDRQGKYNYFDNEAENWFMDNIATNRKKYYSAEDPAGIDFENAKKDAKEKYIDDVLFKNHTNNMKGLAVLKDPDTGQDIDFIRTEEAYFKPLNDYYKAQKNKYLRPENISVVHKFLNVIPGFGTNVEDLNKKIVEGENAFNDRIGKRNQLFARPALLDDRQSDELIKKARNGGEEEDFSLNFQEVREAYLESGGNPALVEDFMASVRDGNNKYKLGTFEVQLEAYLTSESAKLRAVNKANFTKNFEVEYGRIEDGKIVDGSGAFKDFPNPVEAYRNEFNRQYAENVLGIKPTKLLQLQRDAEEFATMAVQLQGIDPKKRDALIERYVEVQLKQSITDPDLAAVKVQLAERVNEKIALIAEEINKAKVGESSTLKTTIESRIQSATQQEISKFITLAQDQGITIPTIKDDRGNLIIDLNKIDDTTSPQYRATYDFFGNKVLLENSELYKSAQAITLSYVEQYDPFAEFRK